MRVRDVAQRVLPWVVSVGVCVALLWPFRDEGGRAVLASAVGRASPWTFPIIVLSAAAAWITDSWTTTVTFRRFGTDISFREACLTRGATYLFDAITPVLGQAALGVMMFRRGTPLARTVQVILLMTVVFMIQLVAVAGLGLLLGQSEVSNLSGRVVMLTLLGAGVYLVLVAVKPPFVARRRAFAQLFEIGVGGHAFAFAARTPNMVAMFAGQMATLYCFGIAVPFAPLLVYIPAIVVVTGAPISVQGIGPAQLAQVAFFAGHVGGDPRVAEATVIAWGLTTTVGHALVWFLIGVGCAFTRTGRTLFAATKSVLRERAQLAAIAAPESE
ncbi:lysylphosphatidylglycerol synthase domain-containing protein [Pendulispora albinea]|uniref:Flippase-like domain-containing protein n=1 Tax=Pendulispora albinea TaxID=2741071 RepID=A0ABZ2MBQ5_9BACT